jgi:hypothetical protein
MNKRFKVVSIFIILLVLLAGCNDKAAIIGEYHKFAEYNFKGMDIMPYDNMSNLKRFSKSEAQEIYDYILTIQSEESYNATEKNTTESPGEGPYYTIALYFEEREYSATVGENYIAVSLNGVYDTVEEVAGNTSIHLVSEEIMNEFVEMINREINDN